MKAILSTAAALIALSGTAVFAEGDAAAGEKDFRKCKSCHAITSPEGESIVKGGKTGPNLYGVIGRQVAAEDFKYGDSIAALGETGEVWTEETLVVYIADPKGFLIEKTGDDAAKSKMTFKLKDGADVAAYLATFSAQ
ncbi:MAG: c-type cytochrome [Maritimibacter sp.]